MSENTNSYAGYHALRWFPEVLALIGQPARAQARVLSLSVLVGLVAGVGAIVFFTATKTAEHFALGGAVGYRPQQPPAGEGQLSQLIEFDTPFRPWLLLVVPTIGGLLSGWLVFTFAPEAEGHGTDSVISAYHQKQGEIRSRVPLVKIVASALTIGSGGSGGREGPIAQIGAGFGSLLARLLHLRPVERRILVAAGMGAGVAAIFRAPLAGALFAAEVLYSSPEFEPEVIMPAAIASVVAYCTFGLYAGWQPLFATPDLTFTNPLELFPYTLLVAVVVALAMLYTRVFSGMQRAFHDLPIPRCLRPAIGACLTGVVGLILYLAFGTQQVLSVLSFGYNAIQQALAHEETISAGVLVAIALGKILTTGLTIGSGGSGGVFGPSMVIGGCGGGALGMLLHQMAPSLVPHPASFVIVGMAGFFAAAAKTPFSTIIIVSEMTGGYHLLLPSLWVCSLAFMLSDKQSIYSSQVNSRSHSPAHQGSYVRAVLAGAHVSQFVDLDRNIVSLLPDDSLATVLDRFAIANSPVLPVVDAANQLLGVVNLEELHLATRASHAAVFILAEDMMRSDIMPLQPEDRLDRALELFVENDSLALPIVSNLEERRVIGMVRRFDIATAYLRHVHGPNRES